MNIHRICFASNTISAVSLHSYTRISFIINTCVWLKKNSLKRKKKFSAVPLYGFGQMCILFLSKPPVYEYSAWKRFFHHFHKCICLKRKISKNSLMVFELIEFSAGSVEVKVYKILCTKWNETVLSFDFVVCRRLIKQTNSRCVTMMLLR